MVIRRVSIDDLEKLVEISERTKFDPLSNGKKGSLVKIPTKEELKLRMQNSPIFLVNEDEGIINGYIICYGDQLLDGLARSNSFYDDGAISFLKSQERPFTYVELMVVDPLSRTRSTSINLSQKAYQLARELGITRSYAVIRHSPQRNRAAILLAKHIGFNFTGKEVKNKDSNFLWGIYSLSLSS